MENEISFWINELEKQTEVNKLQVLHLENLLKDLKFTLFSSKIHDIIIKYPKTTKFLDRLVQRKELTKKKKLIENIVACVMYFAIAKTENEDLMSKSLEWSKPQINRLIETCNRSITPLSRVIYRLDNQNCLFFAEKMISKNEKLSKEFIEFFKSVNFESLSSDGKKMFFKNTPEIANWVLEKYIDDYSENIFDFSFDYWIPTIVDEPILWFHIKNYLEGKYIETKSYKYMNILRNIFMMIQKLDKNLCKYFREDYKETILMIQKEKNISVICKEFKSFKRKDDLWFIFYLFPKLSFYSLESFIKGNSTDLDIFTYIYNIEKENFINFYKTPDSYDSSPFMEFQIELMKNPKNIILEKDSFLNDKLIWIIYYIYTYPEKKSLFQKLTELKELNSVLEKLI